MAVSDNSILVNYGNVSNVVDELTQANAQIQGVLDNLQGQIAALQSTWSGTSESQYLQVQNVWNAKMADMQTNMTKMHVTLEEMSTNYGNTDNNLAAQWGSIR